MLGGVAAAPMVWQCAGKAQQRRRAVVGIVRESGSATRCGERYAGRKSSEPQSSPAHSAGAQAG